MMKRLLGIVCIALGLGVGWVSLGHPGLILESTGHSNTDEQQVLSSEETIQDIQTIEVHTSSTPVEITAARVDNVQAELHKPEHSQATVNMREQGELLQIRMETSGVWLWDWIQSVLSGNWNEQETLIISIPEDYERSLVLEGTSGNYRISDMNHLQEVNIDISSGQVHVENIEADHFNYSGSSGRLAVRQLTSQQSNIGISSGSVTLDEVKGEITGHASSGSVEMRLAKVEQPITWEASSGSITLQVADEASFDLTASMSSGSFDSDFPLKLHAQSRRNMEGSVGDGGAPVNLSVSSGNIRIKQR